MTIDEKLDYIISLLEQGSNIKEHKNPLTGTVETQVSTSTDREYNHMARFNRDVMNRLKEIASGINIKVEEKTTLTAREQTILSQISVLTSGYKKSHWEDGEEYTPKQMFARNGVDYLREEYGK